MNAAVKELDELDQTSQDVAIEIARGLYMDEVRFERAAAFGTIQRHLGELAAELAASAAELLAK